MLWQLEMLPPKLLVLHTRTHWLFVGAIVVWVHKERRAIDHILFPDLRRGGAATPLTPDEVALERSKRIDAASTRICW